MHAVYVVIAKCFSSYTMTTTATLIFCVFVFLTSFSCSLQEVCIVPDAFSGSSKLPPSCETTTSINHFCREASDVPDHTIMTLLSGTHHLNTTCQFRNVNNITVRSETESSVIVVCSPEIESGFQYLNVSKLLMTSIEFRSCRAPWKIPPIPCNVNCDILIEDSVYAGLMVINGTDHTLKKLTVYYSSIVIYNAAGTVNMDSIKVAEFSTGILIMYNIITGRNNFTLSDSLILKQKTDSVMSALSVILVKANLSLYVIQTNFSHNLGLSGAVTINFCDSIASVTISKCDFNACKGQFIGGGLGVIYNNMNSSIRSPSLHIINSTFANNEAALGGGVSLIVKGTMGNSSLYMDMINCSFYGNRASVGSALCVNCWTTSHSYGHQTLIPAAIHVKISTCTFFTSDRNSGWL